MPAPVSLLIPTVDALRAGGAGGAEVDDGLPVAAWEVLSTLVDPRGRRGRRHQLASVLVVSLAAVLAGAKTLAGMADWARDQPGWVLCRVGWLVDRRASRRSSRLLALLDNVHVTHVTPVTRASTLN